MVATAADPDHASTLNYLGYMLADQNMKLEEAFGYIKRAVDLDPSNGAYLDSLGWAYFRLGKFELAEDNLLKASQKINTDPTVHDHMANVLMKASKVREAVSQWETSLKEWESSSPADMEPDEIAQVKRNLEAARVRLAREVPR